MSELGKRERVQAALRGEPVDRVPIGFWGHDYVREWSAEGLAAAMVESVRTYEYDFLKVNPRATYYAEAWGCRYRPSGSKTRGPEVEHWVLHESEDLASVRPVDIGVGPFAEQVEALRRIRAALGGDVPMVQTVFSPLSVVGRLANGTAPVRRWMEEAPAALEGALAAVAETLAAYARACLDAGADGIFFATTEWATFDACTPEQYDRFGRPYDLRVLEAARGGWCNVLHVCRPRNMLERLLDYPVAVFNWAVHAEGNLSLREAQAKTTRAVMGGIDERGALLHGPPEAVAAQVRQAVQETGGRRLLLAPGCSISPETPPEHLRAAVAAAREAL